MRTARALLATAMLVGCTGCLGAKILAGVWVGWGVGMMLDGDRVSYAGYGFSCEDGTPLDALAGNLAERLNRRVQPAIYGENVILVVPVEGEKGIPISLRWTRDENRCLVGVDFDRRWWPRHRPPAGSEDAEPEVRQLKADIAAALADQNIAAEYLTWREKRHTP